MTRLVFLDIDGTILNHQQQIPSSAQHAIGQAISAGHKIILCTGRSKPEIYPFLWELGVRGHIGANGAYAHIDGQTLFNEQIVAQDVHELADWFDLHEIECLWQTGAELYPTRNYLDWFASTGTSPHEIEGDWSQFIDHITPNLKHGLPDSAAKVTFFISPQSGIDLSDVVSTFGDRFTIIRGSFPEGKGQAGELTALGINKSVGMVRVAQYFNVRLQDVIAIGDSANDIEMLTVAGTGVAMGNGIAEAKAAANWVTEPIDHDGLAHAFQKLSLV